MATAMTAGKAISMLRSAIVNARIYPKGSQMVESSLKGAHQALGLCLEDASPLVVSDIQGKLCINGKELPEAKDFRSFLTLHEVQSIKFFKGLELTEVGLLLDGLGRRKGQLDEAKTLGDWLRGKNITHVQAEEVQFVELKKGEVIIQQVIGLMEQSAGDVTVLVRSLDESASLIEQIPEEPARQEANKRVASHLAGLPPQQLRDLFESPWPEKAEKSGLREQVVRSLSREKLEETLEEVHKWYQQIQSESKSQLEVVDKLNGLKSFLGKVLHSPASKQVSFALYEEMLNIKLIDEIPEGVQRSENAGLLVEVEGLLNQPAEKLLEPELRKRLPDLLKGLCAMGKDETLQRLTDKMLDNLQNPAPVVRETAVKAARLFQDTLSSNRKEKPFLQIVSTLHTLSETESAPDVYGQIADALQAAAIELLVSWKFEESAALLGTLRRHARDESPIGQKKKQMAAQSLQDFAVRGLDVICADLNAPIKDRQNGSHRVLAELGEGAVIPLLEAVKRSIDQRSRQAAIQALRKLGPGVRDALLKELNIGVPGDVLVKLIPILNDFADVEMLPKLSQLMQHPDPAVRRQIAQLLGRIRDPKVQTLLAGLLDDAEADVQMEAVRLIGEMRLKLAATELSRRLAAAPASVQEEICIALGVLGEKRAVADLVRLVEVKSSFWRRTAEVPDAVRARALWALGQLLPDDSARKALEKASKHSNGMLARAAQTALNRGTAVARAA